MLAVEGATVASLVASAQFVLVMVYVRLRRRQLRSPSIQLLASGELSSVRTHADLRRVSASTFDRLLLQHAKRCPHEERSRIATLSTLLGRSQAYLCQLRSIWPARRTAAAEALRYLGGAQDVPSLLSRLASRIWSHEAWLIALAAATHAVATEEVRQLLLYLLRYPEVSPKLAATIVAETWAPLAPALREFTRDGDTELCLTALEILRLRPDLTAGCQLAWTDLLRHESPDVRSLSLRLYISTYATLPDLGEGDLELPENWPARAVAAQELGRQGRSAPAVLQRLLEDASWWVRYRSAQSLAELGAVGRLHLLEVATQSQDRYAVDMARDALAWLEHAQGQTVTRLAAEPS